MTDNLPLDKIKIDITIKYKKLFINNRFVNAVDGDTFETINPASEEIICSVASAKNADVELAVNACKNAFELGSEWRSMDPSARGDLLFVSILIYSCA